MKFVLASNNEHKLGEFKRILEPMGHSIVPQNEVCPPCEIEEDGETFRENAYKKAYGIYKTVNMPTIADDSGLCVDALNNAPGVYSARYSGMGDAENNAKLLRELKDVSQEKRTARFVCNICVVMGEDNIIETQGECEGYIGFELRGENGFGYDPLFMVGEKSTAEMSPQEKDSISHRGKALERLQEKLLKLG